MAKKIELKRDKIAQQKREEREKREAGPTAFSFGRDNYMFILIGIGVLVLGYLLMVGGGSDDPNKYNPEIFSTRRITVAPVTLLIGFGIVLYGIMKKPKESAE
jgi:NADH:ubiquinone oxidoreductase subunit K